jgi:hypothetical protein
MSSASASTTTDPGHAVRSDGTLKDASEIAWMYDADKDIPFPSGSTSGQEPHPSGRSAPAVVVAGTHWTTRVHHPLKWALEATEASTSADPGIKHKASTDPNPNRRVSRKIVIDMDDNNNNNNNNNDDDVDGNNAATDFNVSNFDGTEPVDDYEIFEAMAVGRCQQPGKYHFQFGIVFSLASQALAFRSHKQRTADIRLIFRYDEDYVHPHTGMHLKGHWCKICL